jgi:hypothetical protein
MVLVKHGASVAVVVYLLVAIAGAWLPRMLAVAWFRQDWRSALLHPVGIVILLVLQWHALARKLAGGAVSWKNRFYTEK